MPLKLYPPRKGKTPYWAVRGTYLGQYVDRSTKTGRRAVAAKLLRKWERDIESGEFAVKGELTFAAAAAAYMKAGGERRFLTPILKHFGERPIREIDQIAIDAAANVILPNGTAATRNRQVYTPLSAILRHAGRDGILKRPKGSGGARNTAWLWPEQAERLFAEAEKINPRFAALCVTLCYTGMRLSEGLSMEWETTRLQEAYSYVRETKNGEPRPVHLPPVVVAEIANMPGDKTTGPVFKFAKGGHIYSLLNVSAFRAGVELPARSKFHIFCHTFATWMRRYAGADSKALIATGRWKDRKSVDRYTHTVVSEDSKLADALPVTRRISGK